MVSKAKSLYQVKLILDCLPDEEYDLIPQETIDYIEDNFEYDEKFSINPDVPLEEQNIDDKAYDFLEKVVKQAEKVQKGQNKENIIELSKEAEKLLEAKKICEKYKIEYQKLADEKNKEIEKLTKQIYYLQEELNRIPKFIKKIFLKQGDMKMLGGE